RRRRAFSQDSSRVLSGPAGLASELVGNSPANRSLQLPCDGQEYGLSGGAEHHRFQSLGQLKAAGRIPEPPGSTGDLIGLGKVADEVIEVDRKNSIRCVDRQETSLVEAKHASTRHDSKTGPGAIPAAAETKRGRFVSPQRAKSELPEGTAPRQELFVGNRVGLDIDRSRNHASRKRHLHL